MAKIAAKGRFKMAGAAVVKMSGGKAVTRIRGATGGAVAGATIGTRVFPGVGITIGASFGGIVGAVSTGMVMDKGQLMLEEHFGRDQFRGDLPSAIRETRAAFEADLNNERIWTAHRHMEYHAWGSGYRHYERT